METDLAIRILFAVADGELTVRDVRVLMARYESPDAGTKAVSKQTGIPVSSVRRSFRRLQRIESGPLLPHCVEGRHRCRHPNRGGNPSKAANEQHRDNS